MARALENGVVVVHAVTVGDANWLPAAVHNHGSAAIYGPPGAGAPDDGVIAHGKADTAGWVHGEVAPEALRELREADGPLSQPARIAQVEMVALGAPPEAAAQP